MPIFLTHRARVAIPGQLEADPDALVRAVEELWVLAPCPCGRVHPLVPEASLSWKGIWRRAHMADAGLGRDARLTP